MWEKIKEKLALRKNCYEEPDPLPMVVPVCMRSPETTDQRMLRMLANARALAAAEGAETFEEANDFEINDEWDALPASNHEYGEEVERNDKEVIAAHNERNRKFVEERPKDPPNSGPKKQNSARPGGAKRTASPAAESDDESSE